MPLVFVGVNVFVGVALNRKRVCDESDSRFPRYPTIHAEEPWEADDLTRYLGFQWSNGEHTTAGLSGGWAA